MGSPRRAAGARRRDLAAGHELSAIDEENVAGIVSGCTLAGASALDDAKAGEIPADANKPVAVGGVVIEREFGFESVVRRDFDRNALAEASVNFVELRQDLTCPLLLRLRRTR